MVALYILLALFLVWGVYVLFFSGEKYMKWWYRQFMLNHKDYDPRKFKVFHGSCVIATVIIGFLGTLTDDFKFALMVMLTCVGLNYLLTLRCCKKKSQE